MATAFQSNAFQSNAFQAGQIVSATANLGTSNKVASPGKRTTAATVLPFGTTPGISASSRRTLFSTTAPIGSVGSITVLNVYRAERVARALGAIAGQNSTVKVGRFSSSQFSTVEGYAVTLVREGLLVSRTLATIEGYSITSREALRLSLTLATVDGFSATHRRVTAATTLSFGAIESMSSIIRRTLNSQQTMSTTGSALPVAVRVADKVAFTLGTIENLTLAAMITRKATYLFATTEGFVGAGPITRRATTLSIGGKTTFFTGTYVPAFQPSAFQRDAFQTDANSLTYQTGSIRVVEKATVPPFNTLEAETGSTRPTMRAIAPVFAINSNFTRSTRVTEYVAWVALVKAAYISNGVRAILAGTQLSGAILGYQTFAKSLSLKAAGILMEADSTVVGPSRDSDKSAVQLTAKFQMVNNATVMLKSAAQPMGTLGGRNIGIGNLIVANRANIGSFGLSFASGRERYNAVGVIAPQGTSLSQSARARSIEAASVTIVSRETMTPLDSGARFVQVTLVSNLVTSSNVVRQSEKIASVITVKPQLAGVGNLPSGSSTAALGTRSKIKADGSYSVSPIAIFGMRAATSGVGAASAESQSVIAAASSVSGSSRTVERAVIAITSSASLAGIGNWAQRASASVGSNWLLSGSTQGNSRALAPITAKVAVVPSSNQSFTAPSVLGSKLGVSPGVIRVTGVGPSILGANLKTVQVLNKSTIVSRGSLDAKPELAGIGNWHTTAAGRLSALFRDIYDHAIRRILFGSGAKIIRSQAQRNRTPRTGKESSIRARFLSRSPQHAKRIRLLQRTDL